MASIAWFEATQSNKRSQGSGTDLVVRESSLWRSEGLTVEGAESRLALCWQWLSKWRWQRRNLGCKKNDTVESTGYVSHMKTRELAVDLSSATTSWGPWESHHVLKPSNSSATEGHVWNGATVEFCSVYLVVWVSGFGPQHRKGGKTNDHLACSTGILWTWSHRNKRSQWVKKLFMWLQLPSNLPFCGCFHSYRNWKSIFGGLDINISLHNIFSCYCQIFTGRKGTSWWGKAEGLKKQQMGHKP